MSEVSEANSPPKKKTGSARTSKKSKRRNVIRYMEWLGEQKRVKLSPTGVQQQAQDRGELSPRGVLQQILDVEAGGEASPELAGETMIPVASANTPRISRSPDYQTRDASPDVCATALGPLSSPNDQYEHAPTPECYSPTIREITESNYEFQRAREEHKADDWPSESMRPNAQNLRYGGYPAQPAPQNRNTPLGSGRLQNTTKLGAVEFLPSRVVQRNADAFPRQVMARTGALEHQQMVRRGCPTFSRARQAQGHQALRRESAVLSPRHL